MSRISDSLAQLLNVNIEIAGTSYPNMYAEDLAIDRSSLEGEFIEHSERYAYYATLAEMAEDRHNRIKEELDNLVSLIDHEKRQKADAIRQQDPKFKMTEAMFEHEIRLDGRYLEKQKEVQNARHLAKVLKCAPMAFAHRRDMLIELGKKDMSSNDPRITGAKSDQVRALIGKTRQQPQVNPAPGLPAHQGEPTGTACGICRLAQFMTPGGVTCANGHGGALAFEEPAAPVAVQQQPAPAPARRRAPRVTTQL